METMSSNIFILLFIKSLVWHFVLRSIVYLFVVAEEVAGVQAACKLEKHEHDSSATASADEGAENSTTNHPSFHSNDIKPMELVRLM